MSDKDDKLGEFLRRNRPPAPEAPPGERERVWRRIEAELAPRPGRRLRLSLGAAFAAAAVAVVVAITSGPALRNGDAVAEGETMEESLSLSFLEEDNDDELDSFLTALAD